MNWEILTGLSRMGKSSSIDTAQLQMKSKPVNNNKIKSNLFLSGFGMKRSGLPVISMCKSKNFNLLEGMFECLIGYNF